MVTERPLNEQCQSLPFASTLEKTFALCSQFNPRCVNVCTPLLRTTAARATCSVLFPASSRDRRPEVRRIGEPLGRRSFYPRFEHPTVARETRILELRTPAVLLHRFNAVCNMK